jgi:uncharacterized protein
MSPIVIGLLAGLISGSFGVGGGIIIVPGLVLFLHFNQRLSHGTSLLAIMPIAAAGVIGFAFHGSINLAYALFLGIGSILGAVLGTKLLSSISNIWLARIFSAILLITAIRLFVDIPVNSEELALTPADAFILIALGVLAGGIAGRGNNHGSGSHYFLRRSCTHCEGYEFARCTDCRNCRQLAELPKCKY